MSKIIEVQNPGKARLFVELDDKVAGNQRIAVDAGARVLGEVAGTFDDALVGIGQFADQIAQALDGLMRKPDKASVEFGIQLTAGAGFIVASGTASANIKVSMEWKGAK